MNDARRHAPATMRNRDPIAAVLADVLPPEGTVLEIASGSGEHCHYFADRFAHLHWQPSDPDLDALTSIAAWTADQPNVLPPIRIDAAETWPAIRTCAVLCINMVHISPWAATLGLFAGAAAVLDAGAPLILYGPYRQAGVPTAPSNEAFDQSLKARNAGWGLRDLGAVETVADAAGFTLATVHEMPANNLTGVFRRQ